MQMRSDKAHLRLNEVTEKLIEERSTQRGTPGSITQLEQLACQQDRLFEVHRKRPLPVRT